MRLPLRHRPPDRDAPERRCAHLEALVEAAIGLPLGPAANAVASKRSRGRHGNALQWHLGLASHDAEAVLDWEDRIEIKLVSVWKSSDGRSLCCDKLKVSDIAVDPWHKLSNVVFVFADRLTRVVVGAVFFRLAGRARESLARSWELDPHFEHPDLFVEARETANRRAPAYYVSSRWLCDEVLPRSLPGVLPFDPGWWSRVRAEHGRDPLATVVDPRSTSPVHCPRCRGPIAFDPETLGRRGWSSAQHGLPWGDACAIRGHYVVSTAELHPCSLLTPEEFRAGLESRVAPSQVLRLTDCVPEPDDHLH